MVLIVWYNSNIYFLLANDTLDISHLTIDDLKKAIDVPKELRSNQAAIVSYQMEEIRKLVSCISHLKYFQVDTIVSQETIRSSILLHTIFYLEMHSVRDRFLLENIHNYRITNIYLLYTS